MFSFGQVQSLSPSPKAQSSIAVLRTGGRWFDPQLYQYSFRGLMIVIATGFCRRCLLFPQWLCGKAASGLDWSNG